MNKLSWNQIEDFPRFNRSREGSTYTIIKYISSFPNEEVRTSKMEKDLGIRFQLRVNLEKSGVLITFKGKDDRNWTKLTPKGGRLLEYIERESMKKGSNQVWDVFDSQEEEIEDRNFVNEMDDLKLRRSNPPRYDKRKDWYQSLNEKGNDSDVSNRYDQTSLTSGASRWKQTLSELDPPPGFIPTNKGMMTEEDVFDYLDYSSYKANRNYDKFIEPYSNVPNPDYDFEKSRLKWRNFWLNHGGWSQEKLDRFERRYSREHRESNTSIERND